MKLRTTILSLLAATALLCQAAAAGALNLRTESDVLAYTDSKTFIHEDVSVQINTGGLFVNGVCVSQPISKWKFIMTSTGADLEVPLLDGDTLRVSVRNGAIIDNGVAGGVVYKAMNR